MAEQVPSTSPSEPQGPSAASASAPSTASNTDQQAQPSDPPLPKLSPSDFRTYNRMADHMQHFHSHFLSTYTTLLSACQVGKRPQGMSLRQFLSLASTFVSQLTMHHNIEEQHIFPLLATRMPAFKKELSLVGQHRQIHEGLDKLEAYLDECRSGERELRLGEVGALLEGFGDVLMRHLEEEVEQLGAERMRRYWSLEEMRRLPM
ncbi:uncharacterized protein EI97DRAFT_431235 [Westerdykella ornata]|uniref:Hemerythrin-like domain-containing protein n=1 Tax=Westerdykella ornata TaxID=318751 RepID=A0A6A6JTE0_WESOR|nr:uncharacterized protein EI97DRAFT_431235 [Westerdykella ornata]KAF2279016.1 hypothetical protein EI97DRAFT_431235 [Westerdykella ornata]